MHICIYIFEWKKYVHARWLWRTNTWERRRTYVSYKTAGLANDCFNQIKNLPPYTTGVIISEKPIAPTKLVSTDLLNLTLFSDLFNLALADLATLLFAMPAGNHPSLRCELWNAEKVDFIFAMIVLYLSEDFLQPDTRRLALAGYIFWHRVFSELYLLWVQYPWIFGEVIWTKLSLCDCIS